MLAEAQRKAGERGVELDWVQGDMREFDLGRTFDLVIIAANSLLHLHGASDLVDCFRSVRRHMAPGARLVFDVFNPSVQMLAQADGVRRRREALSFVDPDRGVMHVDVAESYDAAAQVTRGRWYFSTESEADVVVAPLEIRSIFPQELPLLLSLGGLRLVERFGDWSGRPSPGMLRSSSASASRTNRRTAGLSVGGDHPGNDGQEGDDKAEHGQHVGGTARGCAPWSRTSRDRAWPGRAPRSPARPGPRR